MAHFLVSNSLFSQPKFRNWEKKSIFEFGGDGDGGADTLRQSLWALPRNQSDLSFLLPTSGSRGSPAQNNLAKKRLFHLRLGGEGSSFLGTAGGLSLRTEKWGNRPKARTALGFRPRPPWVPGHLPLGHVPPPPALAPSRTKLERSVPAPRLSWVVGAKEKWPPHLSLSTGGRQECLLHELIVGYSHF